MNKSELICYGCRRPLALGEIDRRFAGHFPNRTRPPVKLTLVRVRRFRSRIMAGTLVLGYAKLMQETRAALIARVGGDPSATQRALIERLV